MLRTNPGARIVPRLLALMPAAALLAACGSGSGGGGKLATVSFTQPPGAIQAEGHSGTVSLPLTLLLALTGIPQLPESLVVTRMQLAF